MVWIVEGRLKQNGEIGSPQTFHYLRPSRRYNITSFPGAYPDPKIPGKTLTAKARMRDFTLNPMPSIPRKGAGELEGGDWTDENVLDNNKSATNFEPYALTYRSESKDGIQTVTRKGEIIPLVQSKVFPLQSGDIIKLPGKNHITVTWIPHIFCMSTLALTDAQKLLYIQKARTAGIKLAFDQIHRHHTHYVARSSSPNRQICLAAIFQISIVSVNFLNDFFEKSQVPARPIGIELHDLILSDSDEVNLAKKYPDVGGDFKRWWGHSALELDWSTRPKEEDYLLDSKNDVTVRAMDWSLREERPKMFAGILVISCRNDADADRQDAELVRNGGGNFLNLIISDSSSPASLVAIVKTHLETLGMSQNGKFVFLTPFAYQFEVLDTSESLTAVVAREFAKSIGTQSYQSAKSLVESIGAVDLSILFAEDQEHQLPSMSKNKGKANSLAIPPSTPNSSTLPASSFILGGTHPEESSIGGTRNASRHAGPSSSVGYGEANDLNASPRTNGDEEMLPPVIKKLTRRLKSRATQPSTSTYDEIWGLDPKTQASGPEFSLETGTTGTIGNEMDIDSAFAGPSSTRPTKLKRRVGTNITPDESQDDDVFGLQLTSRPAKKSRQQLLEEEEEERLDTLADNLAKTKVSATKRSTRASSVVSEDGETTGGKGKKRAASEAISSDEEGATTKKKSHQPVSKKSKSSSINIEAVLPTPSSPKSTKATKPLTTKEKAALTKAEKARKQIETDSGVLQVVMKKGKLNAKDKDTNDEFNKLKLVTKPSTVAKHYKPRDKLGWNDVDGLEEQLRLQREAEEKAEHPEKWTQEAKQKSFFVIEYLDMVRKDRIPPRSDIVLEEKYVGRPNFKRFRPKNAVIAGAPIIRQQAELVLCEPADFGLGEAYHGERRIHYGSQSNDNDDDDMDRGGTQPKLNFKSKPSTAKSTSVSTSKGKGKAKATAKSTDMEEDEAIIPTGIKTKGSRNREEMEIDELDSDDSVNSITQTLTSNPIKSKSKVNSVVKAAPKKAAPTKKKQPATIVIDSESDSDSGLTFKGFASTAKGTGTKRKR